MLIYKGTMGFCCGVRRAIDTAINARSDKKVIYTLGKIIHNDIVVQGLQAIGILAVDNIKALSKGDKVVICSHGTTKDNFDFLLQKEVEVIDGTCPFVKKIHDKVYLDSKNGYNIVIVGDSEHTEVKGIAGWCNDNYQIISDIKEMDFSVFDKFSVVCQTTFPVHKYREIKKNMQSIATKLAKIVVFFDSICYTTLERQKEAAIIAEKSDVVLVLGDKSSSNTNKLYNIAKQKCPSVFLISNKSELSAIKELKISKLGILSGASTPDELITEVINIMIETNSNGIVKIEDVSTTKDSPNMEEVQQKQKNEKKEISMKEALKKFPPKTYKEGMRLKARVVSADNNGILVALQTAGKNDTGFIDKDEVEIDGNYNPENYKPDDELDVIIIRKSDKNDRTINLSKKAYDQLKIDDEKVKGILAGDEFTLVCTQEVKGGLLGKIGTYTVFVPASQIKMSYVHNLSDYLNKPLRLRALPPKDDEEETEKKKSRNPKRIVASQRIILEEEKMKREEEFWNSIPEGSIVSGKVKRFASFGAFVSLKYMDALVHNSELSWSKKKINSPDEVLELNKTYDFKVLSVNREEGKISLGYKQLQPKPEEIALTKYPVGSVLKGKVVRLVKFGAFVELEPGIDGLVHVSQINHGWIKSPNEALKVGDEVEVKVIGIDNDRITLSIKELLPEEPVAEAPAAEEDSAKAKDNKVERKGRKQKEEETPREYISSSSVVTLGDLLSQVNLQE
ncbi:MAG: 4-hydroxy-3-methylbut-2-enyl diphosphate reductase [Christensenellales bacterium]|jgi:(E)-4-hydroxy-3-methyl-but-2-enyl pyrophosphate reductase